MSSISKAMSRVRPDLTPAKNFSVPSDKDPYLKAEQRDQVRKPIPAQRKKLPDWYTPQNVATSATKPKPGLRFQMNQRTGLMLAIMVCALMAGTVGGVVFRQGQVTARMQAMQVAPPAMVGFAAPAELAAVAGSPTPVAEVIAEFASDESLAFESAPAALSDREFAARETVPALASSAQFAPESTEMTAPPAQLAMAEPVRVVAIASTQPDIQAQPMERVMLEPRVGPGPVRVTPVQAIYEAPEELPGVPMGVMHEVLYEGDAVPDQSAEPIRVKAATSSVAKSKSKPEPVEVRLEGIFWDRTRPMAILNGEIVEVGDPVPGGGEISEIQRSAVIVKQDGKLRTLRP